MDPEARLARGQQPVAGVDEAICHHSISSVEQLTATILQRLGLGAGGLVLLYEDADFEEFLALTEMSELPENANVKLVPSVSGAQSLSVGLRGLT